MGSYDVVFYDQNGLSLGAWLDTPVCPRIGELVKLPANGPGWSSEVVCVRHHRTTGGNNAAYGATCVVVEVPTPPALL